MKFDYYSRVTVNAFGVPFRQQSNPAFGPPAVLAEPRKTFGYRLVLCLWLLYMFEPQTFVANFFHVPVVAKLLLVLLSVLALILATRPPKLEFVLPYGLIVVLIAVGSLFAVNTGYARAVAIQSALFYVFALGVVTFVKSPKQVLPFVATFMVGEFIWWGLWGVRNGAIRWHGEYANYDGFGPLMGFGLAGAFPYAVATTNKRARLIAIGVGLLCVMGLVSTFARGAFLSAVAILGWMWLNAPRKGVATGFVVAAVLALLLATQVFSGEQRGAGTASSFLDEMRTIVTEVQANSGTTGQRHALWGAAVAVWKKNPLIGAGAKNCGIYGATYFSAGYLDGVFGTSPGELYNAALHNIFYQVLCEYGLIGCGLYLWLLVDFFRRNHRLRSREFRATWVSRGGGTIDLKWISIGLTGMMIGILANGWFYNILNVPWLPTLVVMNAILYRLAKPASIRPERPVRGAVA